MVFLLRHVSNGTILVLGPNARYTLGKSRRNCIQLCDATVANSHATLEIGGGHANIIDNDTDFGTWVNKRRISEPFRLRNGDVIVFGKKQCKYVFLEPNFEVQVDQDVSKQTKNMLADTLKKLNISLVERNSRTSSHYVTDLLTLEALKDKTILYHLIDRKTVVTPKYFFDILTNIEAAPTIPNIYRYMPEIDSYLKSKGIEDINPRQNRKHIFECVAFIFFDKQCDEDLCDLIIKCGGEAVLCNQKNSFYSDLLEITKGYQYVAVNHSKNHKKSSIMYVFLRTMRKKKKEVVEIDAEDIYVSVLKGQLVGVREVSLQANFKEPHPGTSKTVDSVVLNSSDNEASGPESEPVDIVCKITNDKESGGQKGTSERAATPHDQPKTLRETILQNNQQSPTLNKWVTRTKKDNKNLNQKTFDNEVTSSSTIINETEVSNQDQGTNALRDKQVDYDRLLTELEEIFGTSEDIVEKRDSCTSPIPKRKRKESIQDEVQNPVQSGSSHSTKATLERVNSKVNGKKSSVVINPFAMGQSPKIIKEEKKASPVEKWLKRYKHVDIIPMA